MWPFLIVTLYQLEESTSPKQSQYNLHEKLTEPFFIFFFFYSSFDILNFQIEFSLYSTLLFDGSTRCNAVVMHLNTCNFYGHRVCNSNGQSSALCSQQQWLVVLAYRWYGLIDRNNCDNDKNLVRLTHQQSAFHTLLLIHIT